MYNGVKCVDTSLFHDRKITKMCKSRYVLINYVLSHPQLTTNI